MNWINFGNPGVLRLYQEGLKAMQDTYTPVLTALTKSIGDNIILEGCVRNGSTVSAGIVIMANEVLPFDGGNVLDGFKILATESVVNGEYEDGQQRDFIHTRKAVPSMAEGVLFSNFVNIRLLKDFRSLPVKSGEDYSQPLTDTLATIKALYDLKKDIMPRGMVLMWSGNINEIPAGYALCDGNNGTPNLIDKFIVGAGNEYWIGAQGGEKTHVLTINEMPSHTHGYRFLSSPGGGGDGGRAGVINDGTQTASAGGGAAHENRPPYYSLAYIMKL